MELAFSKSDYVVRNWIPMPSIPVIRLPIVSFVEKLADRNVVKCPNWSLLYFWVPIAYFRKLAANIVKLINQGAYNVRQENRWIYLIPIYHLVSNVSADTRGNKQKHPRWWGTQGFDDCVQRLKANSARYSVTDNKY